MEIKKNYYKNIKIKMYKLSYMRLILSLVDSLIIDK